MQAQAEEADTMPQAIAQATSVSLGHEELIYLLRALHTSSMPGVDTQAFYNLSQAEQLLVLAAAAHSLQARRYIEVQPSGGIVIDKLVLALLGTCLTATAALTIEQYTLTNEHTYGIHQTEHLCVEHYNHGTTHTLAVVQDVTQTLHSQLQQHLPPATPETALDIFPVNIDQLQQARYAVLDGSAAAYDLLAQAGIPHQQIDHVFSFFQAQTSTIALTAMQRTSSAQAPDTLQHLILASANHALEVVIDEQQRGRLHSLNSAALERTIIGYFQHIAQEQDTHANY